MRKIAILIGLMSYIFIPAYSEKFRSYGAGIAINRDLGITGYANNYKTDVEAARKALESCNKKSNTKKNCKLAIAFADGCGAVAWSPSTKVWNADTADSELKLAKKIALHKCGQRASDCKIIEAFCTNWETVESTLIWW